MSHMLETASSTSVKDVETGTLLVNMHFSGLSDAIYYMTAAKLVCSECGKVFGGSSTVTLMKRDSWWELMLPHNCEPHVQEGISGRTRSSQADASNRR